MDIQNEWWKYRNKFSLRKKCDSLNKYWFLLYIYIYMLSIFFFSHRITNDLWLKKCHRTYGLAIWGKCDIIVFFFHRLKIVAEKCSLRIMNNRPVHELLVQQGRGASEAYSPPPRFWNLLMLRPSDFRFCVKNMT